jgi:hypothetical protein
MRKGKSSSNGFGTTRQIFEQNHPQLLPHTIKLIGKLEAWFSG